MSDLRKALGGAEYDAKMEAFEADIRALNEKYKGELEEGDKVEKYYIMTTNILPGRVTFNTHDPENKLPKHIKDEMMQIFQAHFSPK